MRAPSGCSARPFRHWRPSCRTRRPASSTHTPAASRRYLLAGESRVIRVWRTSGTNSGATTEDTAGRSGAVARARQGGVPIRDVIVIGAGGGGAVIAKELASRGLDVLVLEAGPRFIRPEHQWSH